MTGPVPAVRQALEERRVELLITRKVELQADENVIGEDLFDDDIVVVAGARNPWSRRRRIELADLASEP